MTKNVRVRLYIILGVMLLALFLLFGPFRLTDPLTGEFSASVFKSNFTLTQLRKNLADNIKLGLDLKGGSHLILKVQTTDALQAVTDGNIAKARDILQKENIQVKNVVSPRIGQVVVEMDDTTRIEDVKKFIGEDFGPGWVVETQGKNVVFTIKPEEAAALANRATEQALRIIETRVNEFGVAEPTIQRHGPASAHQILVQLPGVDDPERVKNLIRAESRLELKLVTNGPFASRDEALKELGGTVPPDKQILPVESRRRSADEPKTEQYYVVEKTPVVTGAELRRAQGVISRTGANTYEILFSLRPEGAKKFGEFTGSHIGKQLAIVLNDVIKSAPNIKSRIEAEGVIEGDFTKEEADDLALTLNSGALPARLTYLEERTVGPSLGADSIRQGVAAALVGLALVVVAMILYYRLSGVNAVVALVLNVFLLLAALRLFGAVLTLPGIAGIALTIGMAVDANVLVFERIREELKSGKVVMSAVTLGFDRAFVTIFDSNVTTIIAALFLFVFGTGPIRGFAVTLVCGLLANLFTAVFASKTFFLWLLSRQGAAPERLSI
ncbi:MAG: protein translocase subunit SecD [Acidobacteriota bacterium]|nr:protein translocase subunit SecD [Blastocatellia bacterium]MDW8238979.1 protein translocase subunit SecD [Acidobacteriota bacterium]